MESGDEGKCTLGFSVILTNTEVLLITHTGTVVNVLRIIHVTEVTSYSVEKASIGLSQFVRKQLSTCKHRSASTRE